MYWRSKLVHICLALHGLISGAQSPQPIPDTTLIIQQVIHQQKLAESKEQDYVFREDTEDNRLRKQCTWAPVCPVPCGTGRKCFSYQVLSSSDRHFEIFWLNGTRVARILPHCNHCGTEISPGSSVMKIPISKDELAAENQRVMEEVAEAKALQAQGKSMSSPDYPPQFLFSRMLELCSFAYPRRISKDDRPTLQLDFVCSATSHIGNGLEGVLSSLAGTIDIDEEDRAVREIEGSFHSNVSMEHGNVQIRKGTRITITNRRIEPGIWMLSQLNARGEGHYFSFAFNGDGHIAVGPYRKFRSTSKILSESDEPSPTQRH